MKTFFLILGGFYLAGFVIFAIALACLVSRYYRERFLRPLRRIFARKETIEPGDLMDRGTGDSR